MVVVTDRLTHSLTRPTTTPRSEIEPNEPHATAGGKPADVSASSLQQFERLEPLLARQMSATDDERVLSVLQDLLPADTAAALHEHARELMQRRARAASAPVDEALRARVAALESQAVELADAIQKQRGDAPEWASQRLDEEQRRALSALLTADALQPPPEAPPPPTPDSQLLLNAQRCQGSEERTLSALETLQASTGASSSLLQKLAGLGAEGLTSDATHQAIVRTRPSNPSPDPKADASHQAIVAIAVSAPTPRRPTTRLCCRAWPAADLCRLLPLPPPRVDTRLTQSSPRDPGERPALFRLAQVEKENRGDLVLLRKHLRQNGAC